MGGMTTTEERRGKIRPALPDESLLPLRLAGPPPQPGVSALDPSPSPLSECLDAFPSDWPSFSPLRVKTRRQHKILQIITAGSSFNHVFLANLPCMPACANELAAAETTKLEF